MTYEKHIEDLSIFALGLITDFPMEMAEIVNNVPPQPCSIVDLDWPFSFPLGPWRALLEMRRFERLHENAAAEKIFPQIPDRIIKRFLRIAGSES